MALDYNEETRVFSIKSDKAMTLSELSVIVGKALSDFGNMSVIARVAGNESYSPVDFRIDYVYVELGGLPDDTVKRITPRLVIVAGE